ncbi:MAG: hypothetical protein M1838_002388 [Thelocarpon superellum]|nr:MAG: hypothetical protein M1838_002388 [Thelocarpon superellum]
MTGNDEIKSKQNPTEGIQYCVSKNDRYNQKHKEAVCAYLRHIVAQRLLALQDSISIRNLPLGIQPTKPHIPILISPHLSRFKRVVLVFNEGNKDLGIWSYHSMATSGRGGINGGSVINLLKTLSARSPPVGLIVANLGQLLWSPREQKAMSFDTWFAQSKPTAVHPAPRIDGKKNRVEGNTSMADHTRQMIERVVGRLTAPDAMIDVIALSDGARVAVRFLDMIWASWSSRFSALALGNPLHDVRDLTSHAFATFLHQRTRAYLCSTEPAGTRFSDPIYGCPCESSGEVIPECIMPTTYPKMLDFFDEVASRDRAGASTSEDHSLGRS